MAPADFFAMSPAEAACYVDGWEKEREEKWEMVRRLMWTIAQVNSSRELDPEDIMKFPWDAVDEDEDADSEARWEEARKAAEYYKDFIKSNLNGKQ